jgi:probable F420-dependent oxidoreductase
MADFGILMFATDYSIQPVELAIAAEERGFESMFFPEHSHIPASRKTPYPLGRELPKEYWHMHDPFVALAAAAAVTKKIKVGTGICLVVERDPIMLAKEVASLDTISGGRAILGIGGGWNVEEMENHGAIFKRRWAIVREKILAMREIWTKEAAEFHGEFVNFDPIWSYPKPVQPGGPPVLLGSMSPKTFDRVAEYCDGWLPLNSRRYDMAAGIKSLRQAQERAGRKKLSVSVFGLGPDRDTARKMIDLGADRLIFALPAAPRDGVIPMLDGYAEMIAKLGAAV